MALVALISVYSVEGLYDRFARYPTWHKNREQNSPENHCKSDHVERSDTIDLSGQQNIIFAFPLVSNMCSTYVSP